MFVPSVGAEFKKLIALWWNWNLKPPVNAHKLCMGSRILMSQVHFHFTGRITVRFDLTISFLQQLCDTLPTGEMGIIKKELSGYMCLYYSVKVKVKVRWSLPGLAAKCHMLTGLDKRDKVWKRNCNGAERRNGEIEKSHTLFPFWGSF